MKKTSILKYLLTLVLIAAAAIFVSGTARADKEVSVDNGIPVVYLNIDETQGTIEEMNRSWDHSVYCYGTVSIEVPEGFHYTDFPDLPCDSLKDLAMSIRGRGNSSWRGSMKKPYKIKLDKKTDVFGLGKNKHWVLVANDYDASLLKDRITGWLGDEMGFPFTPRGVPVDVVMTGQEFGTKYLGSYYLSENVRVDDNRLEIQELSEDDTDPATITGGYLLQNAMQVRDGSPDRFYTKRGVDWATHTPSFDTEADNLLGSEAEEADDGREEVFAGAELGDAYENPAQQQYIQDYIQQLEDILFEGGTKYRDYFDVESAARYWLVQKISMNGDAYMTGSTYIYKDRDPEDGIAKLYWGPLWDFDYAWNFREFTYGFDVGHKWLLPMFYDRSEGGFVEELHKQWPVMRAGLQKLTEEGGLIDRYYEETKASAEMNAKLIKEDDDFDYRKEVDALRNWIITRVAWVDENFSLLDDLVHTLTFVADGEVYAVDFREDGTLVDGTDPHPEKEGYTFLGWMDEDGVVVKEDAGFFIKKDTTLTAKLVPDSEVTHAEDVAFPISSDVIAYNVHIHRYDIPFTVLPEDADDKAIEWISSNEEFATVDRYGTIIFEGEGEVTVTAKLKYGKSRDFTLTVTKDGIEKAKTMHPEEKVIRMQPGKQSPLTVRTTPSPAVLCDFVYRSEDPGIVKVDDNGVLTAVAPGKAKVYVEAATSHDAKPDILTTFVNVFVEGKVKDEAASSAPKEVETTEENTTESETETETEAESESEEVLLGEKRSSRLTPLWIALIAVGCAGLIAALILFLKRRAAQKNAEAEEAEAEVPAETEAEPNAEAEAEPQAEAEPEAETEPETEAEPQPEEPQQ